MQFFSYKKEQKEIKSNINCIFCGRLLNSTELFNNSNYCIICKIKYGLKKPNATLDQKIKQ